LGYFRFWRLQFSYSNCPCSPCSLHLQVFKPPEGCGLVFTRRNQASASNQ